MRFDINETLVIAIDYQEKLVPAMNNKETLIAESAKLLKGLKILDVPAIFTQQYTKGLGMTVDALRNAYNENTDEFKYFDKKRFSCYEDNAIKEAIDASGKKNVIICGMEAHICVLQTAIDMRKAGFNVMIVTDCVSSRKEMDMNIALKRAIQEGILLTTCEAVLFELTGGADADKFKDISKLIK